jgi:hypothetical protein
MAIARLHTEFDTDTNLLLDRLFREYTIAENWAEHTGWADKDYAESQQAYQRYLDAKREAFAKRREQ